MPHYPAFFPCLTSVDDLGAITAVSDWLDRASSSGGLTHHGPPLTMNTLLHALIKAYEIQGYFLLRNAFNNVGLDHTIQVKLCLHGRSFMDYWVAGTAMHGCPVACMDGCKPAASVPLRHEHTVGPAKEMPAYGLYNLRFLRSADKRGPRRADITSMGILRHHVAWWRTFRISTALSKLGYRRRPLQGHVCGWSRHVSGRGGFSPATESSCTRPDNGP